jgi:hypothetical protein
MASFGSSTETVGEPSTMQEVPRTALNCVAKSELAVRYQTCLSFLNLPNDRIDLPIKEK